MTQPHTQTYTPAKDLFVALEGFCRAGRTGVGITYVVSDQAKDVRRIAHDLDLRSQFAEADRLP